jgi:hypothetical protein
MIERGLAEHPTNVRVNVCMCLSGEYDPKNTYKRKCKRNYKQNCNLHEL